MFVQIIDDVRATFKARGITADVLEGVDARAQQFGDASPEGRVCFVPIQEIEVEAPRFVGEDDTGVRMLWNTLFGYEVSFLAFDRDQPERDVAHRKACYDLWEATTQAIHAAYNGMYHWTGARWNDSRVYQRHGAELLATLTLEVPLFDLASVLAAPKPKPGQPKPA